MSRKAGGIALGILGLLLAGMIGLNLLVPPPAPEARAAEPGALIGGVVGQVEVRERDSQRWQAAAVGAPLGEGDEIRTGLFSEAGLHLRGGSSVTVGPNSVFVVGQEFVERSDFELGEGRIVAAIPGQSKREFQFRSRGSEAIASADEGAFSLATDGKGTVVVDAHAGAVRLESKGRRVQIDKGRRSIVLPDQPPSDVLAVPASVALQVRWPALKIDRTRIRLSGKTDAAATVLVNGILVRADAQGEFELDVPLQEGKNRLVVSATDAAGNTSLRQSPEILVDTRPPDLKVDSEGLWR